MRCFLNIQLKPWFLPLSDGLCDVLEDAVADGMDEDLAYQVADVVGGLVARKAIESVSTKPVLKVIKGGG